MPFISREKLRQSLVFLIFIAVAFSLWLLKALNEEYETDISVEVTVAGLPPGVELDVDDKSQMQMQVAVHGSGTALIGYMFGDPLKIEVDYSEFNDNNGSLSIPVSQLKNRVSSKLNSYTTLVHFKGESFGVEIKRKLKNLPINVVADVKPAPGYEIKSVKTETEHLLVSAPPSYYSWLKNIEVGSVACSDIASDTVFELSVISSKKYVDIDQKSVKLMVDVEPLATVEKKIPLVFVNLPYDVVGDVKSVYDTPDYVSVKFEVSKENFDKAMSDSIVAEVDLRVLEANEVIKLKTVPEYVIGGEYTLKPSCVEIAPKKIDYLIKGLFSE